MTGGTLTTATGAIVWTRNNATETFTRRLNAASAADPATQTPGVQFTVQGNNRGAVTFYGHVFDLTILNYSVPFAAWGQTVNGGGLGTHDAMTPTYQPTASIAEILNLLPQQTPNIKYGIVLTDQVLQAAMLQAGWPVTVNGGGIGMHDAMTIIRGVIISELLNISPILTPNAKYGKTIAEQIKALDGLFRFVTASMIDGIGMHDGQIILFQPTAHVTDVVQIHPVQTPTLVFGMEIDDQIHLTHTQVLKAIYQGDILLDGIQLRALYVNPNGKYTTWTMNTRTGAVTEYQNYVFNSFAAMGNHYIGAKGVDGSPPGLFVLDDARDNGANIIADIKSGRMAIGGTKFTSFRSAYLGLNVNDTSGESFILKMVAGDGREYVYGVKPNAPGTITKVNMGKGLRSRYFSFELTSDGSDFDLDTIEFIPIVSGRRV